MDDTRLMGMARTSEAMNIRKDLDIYLKALGQRINDDKFLFISLTFLDLFKMGLLEFLYSKLVRFL